MAVQKSSRIGQLYGYATEFYLRKLPILLLFSVPAVIAFLIPVFVPAPTFLALGAEVLRTGSLPDLSAVDIAVTLVAYLASLFLIADSIANINLVIKSRRTFNPSSSEVFSALSTYAVRITYLYTVLLFAFAVLQLLTLARPFETVLYPLGVLLVSYFSFFAAPAIAIDNASVPHALGHSVRMALRKPLLFLAWTLTGFVLLSLVRLLFTAILPGYASALTLGFNALFVLPYLIILQTQMYLEKYPLAH